MWACTFPWHLLLCCKWCVVVAFEVCSWNPYLYHSTESYQVATYWVTRQFALELPLSMTQALSKSMEWLFCHAWLATLSRAIWIVLQVSLMFLFSGLEASSGFSYVVPRTVFAWNFVNNITLKIWGLSELWWREILLKGFKWFVDNSDIIFAE